MGLVEGEPFGSSCEEDGLRLMPVPTFIPGARVPEETRTIHAEIRTDKMVQYMTPQELGALIKSKSNDHLVVDVRDDDYQGGNIKGGINIPSEKFLLKLHQLIDDTQNTSKIIFHCTLSQQR